MKKSIISVEAKSRISIIIPVYNVERYLRRCLDSVINQTYTEWEAVCVNDGSPDNSLSILEEYAQKDHRIKVVSKENGGLSDARNLGLSNSTGAYVMFLDSDDLIHPQTMEIAMRLAQRDNSDIVSWYKDQFFHLEMRLKAKLGYDVDSALPFRINRRYDLRKIDSYVTDDVFAHVTECSHTKIKYPIKHFFVVRHLLKRELVEDVKFLKGVTFEDFPWWSEVILKNPRVTITNLPFYYYFPNKRSIVRSSIQANKILNWITGLGYSYNLYQEKANDYQFKQWSENCMWPVIVYQIARKLKEINETKDRVNIRERLQTLWNRGVFATPKTPKEKYYKEVIKNFIERH